MQPLQLASAELRAGVRSALPQPAHSFVPAGFKRELARLLGASALSLPLFLLWNLAVIWLGQEILSTWLPPSFIWSLVGAYAFGAIGWLALAGSLGLLLLYLPGSPSALQWPVEWGLVLLWYLLGVVFYRKRARR